MKLPHILTICFLVFLPLAATSQYIYKDFTSSDISDWVPNAYSISHSAGTLQIQATAIGASYQAFAFNFSALDMSGYPKISLRIKASNPVNVRIDLQDVAGKVTNADGLVKNVTSTDFQDFTYDFTGKFNQLYPNAATVDATQIKSILVYFNPGSTFTGTVNFDDLIIGRPTGAAMTLEGNLDFGQVLIGETKSKDITIVNYGAASLNVSAVTLPAGFTSNVTSAVIATDATKTVTVTFAPTAETTINGEVVITSDATHGKDWLLVSGQGVTIPPAEDRSDLVRVNQVGYYLSMEKLGVVVNGAAGMPFKIWKASLDEVVFEGELGASAFWDKSNENVSIADFSSFTSTGEFVLEVPGIGRSYPFSIATNVLEDASKASIKAYYYNRASTALESAHAGTWARAAGHPDTSVKVHASAASAARPVNTVISSPKGWYDAGDYGKYIVNGGIAVHTLLSAYEAFSPYYDNLVLNIPESNNSIPDLLDEVLWELDWMITMQDPNDGGVYHKLTTLDFGGFMMPEDDDADRYVYYKSTAAALNFSAVMAQASRVYKPFNESKSATFLSASKLAWEWALANPTRYYVQSEINNTFDPNVNTGEYGDTNVKDEFNWAGLELYITTQDETFLSNVDLTLELKTADWPSVNFLGYASVINNKENISNTALVTEVEADITSLANALRTTRNSSPYKISHRNFNWGSNSLAGNEGIALMYAYRISNDESYLKAALSNLDYLLGRNAVNYSFLTGHGSKLVNNIHHRPSGADGIADAVPGFIVGGPDGFWESTGFCGGTIDFGDIPAKAFQDVECAPDMTEVAVNWNSPFVFLAGAMEYFVNQDLYSITAPTNLKVEALTSTSVKLTWTDNSPDEENFILETASSLQGPFTQLAAPAQNAEVYEHEDLSPGATYFYRVKAVAGIKTSGYSNTVTFTAEKIDQIITFNELSEKTLGDAPFEITATASSGLAVSFSSASDKITIADKQITLKKAGRVTITASQAGNISFNEATPVEQSFCIRPAKPTISISDANTESPTLTSSASAGNQWFMEGVAINGATAATLKITEPGVYKVQVKVDDCISEFSDNQEIIITDVFEGHSGDVVVYPNPATDWLTISLTKLQGKKKVEIFRSDGTRTDAREVDGNEAKFNVADYAKGMHIVRVTAGTSVKYLKFVKR